MSDNYSGAAKSARVESDINNCYQLLSALEVLRAGHFNGSAIARSLSDKVQSYQETLQTLDMDTYKAQAIRQHTQFMQDIILMKAEFFGQENMDIQPIDMADPEKREKCDHLAAAFTALVKNQVPSQWGREDVYEFLDNLYVRQSDFLDALDIEIHHEVINVLGAGQMAQASAMQLLADGNKQLVEGAQSLSEIARNAIENEPLAKIKGDIAALSEKNDQTNARITQTRISMNRFAEQVGLQQPFGGVVISDVTKGNRAETDFSTAMNDDKTTPSLD